MLPLEAVELCERVLPDGQQEVHSQVGLVHDRGELAREGALAVVVRVVEEVVLELVEDDEQRAYLLGPGGERLDDGAAGLPRFELRLAEQRRGVGPDRLHQRWEWIVAPGREDADRERGALESLGRFRERVRSEVVDDACPQQRGLADSALAVEERQTKRAEVAADDPLLLLAAEEEGGVLLAVGNEADVRRFGWDVRGMSLPRGWVRHAGDPEPKSTASRRAK